MTQIKGLRPYLNNADLRHGGLHQRGTLCPDSPKTACLKGETAKVQEAAKKMGVGRPFSSPRHDCFQEARPPENRLRKKSLSICCEGDEGELGAYSISSLFLESGLSPQSPGAPSYADMVRARA